MCCSVVHVHGTVGAQHCLVDNIFDELLNLTEMYLGSRSVMYLEVQAPLSQGWSVVGGESLCITKLSFFNTIM